MSFFIGIIDSVDDVGEKHIVIPINYADKIILVSILKRNEVSSHKATDKTLILVIRISTLVVGLLFESSVGVNSKVRESLPEF